MIHECFKTLLCCELLSVSLCRVRSGWRLSGGEVRHRFGHYHNKLSLFVSSLFDMRDAQATAQCVCVSVCVSSTRHPHCLNVKCVRKHRQADSVPVPCQHHNGPRGPLQLCASVWVCWRCGWRGKCAFLYNLFYCVSHKQGLESVLWQMQLGHLRWSPAARCSWCSGTRSRSSEVWEEIRSTGWCAATGGCVFPLRDKEKRENDDEYTKGKMN